MFRNCAPVKDQVLPGNSDGFQNQLRLYNRKNTEISKDVYVI